MAVLLCGFLAFVALLFCGLKRGRRPVVTVDGDINEVRKITYYKTSPMEEQ